MLQRILIWDAPTRAFHWLQVIAFFGAYATAESERYRDIHLAFGYILLSLIVFRLVWGFLGTRYARFNSFLFKPAAVAGYLLSLFKGKARHYVGHNPAGSVAVWLLLALGALLCVTGLMALQDDAGDSVVELHEVLTNIMLAAVALHVIGVLVSSLMHRENLIRSMITGYKLAETKEAISRSYNLLGMVMIAAAVTFWLVYLR
jgi:cytochrome b